MFQTACLTLATLEFKFLLLPRTEEILIYTTLKYSHRRTVLHLEVNQNF